MSSSGSIQLLVAGRTDVGLVREHNEDNFIVVDLASGVVEGIEEMRSIDVSPKGVVLLVCDGMGGAAAGEIASAMAVEVVTEVMRASAATADGNLRGPDVRKTSFARRLRSAAYTANERIHNAARRDPSKGGMGTTMTAVGVVDGHLVMAQVGDSRAYLLRGGVLTQLTRDQSLVNELLETGQITEEQAVMFEHSNVILQALGVQPDVEVLLSTVELRRGDRLVVCSDGLTGVVPDEEVGALAASSDDTSEGCRLLIEVARGAGGPDNITAIVARFDGEGLPLPAPDEPTVTYRRWRLDESVKPEDDSRPGPGDSPAAKPRSKRRSRQAEFARAFFSAMVLFALAMGSLITVSLLTRSAPSQRCTVIAAPGFSVRVDGYDTGEHTRTGGVELHLPPGRHRIRLQGPGAPVGERHVEVSAGAACAAHFDGIQ